MNGETGVNRRRVVLRWIGVLGVLLLMAVLVAALKRYTRPEGVNAARAQERHKILAGARQKASDELATAAWIDREKGFVRLPNAVAMEATIRLMQDPARARTDLVARAEKAFFIPPPPPEPPSQFE